MDKLISFLRSKPVFFLLLPFFFVFHGWVENYNAIPVKDAGWLLLIYLFASLILFFLSWLVFRNMLKAALLSFCLMAFHFFFGGMHDVLKNWFDDAFISRYSFLLPFFLALFIILFIVLKKNRSVTSRACFYLNILVVLIFSLIFVFYFFLVRIYV